MKDYGKMWGCGLILERPIDSLDKRILILGRNSWLGARFFENIICKRSFHSDIDVLHLAALRSQFREFDPDVVINCVGKTGRPNIDWCENNKAETLLSNTIAPALIAEVCKEYNAKMIHISSGCIYGLHSDIGYKESSPPSPNSFYGETKVMAERLIERMWTNVLILRIRMPIDIYPHERNLITKLSKYDKVVQAQNSVTIVPDLIEATKALIKADATGIYHVTNPGFLYHDEILTLYKAMVDPQKKWELINQLELKNLCKTGRSNCLLNTDKLSQVIKLPGVKERMIEILEQYAKQS